MSRQSERQRWAVRLPRDRAEVAGRLRTQRGIEACESEGEVWLRGETCDERLERLLAALPAATRWGVLEDGSLVAPGRHVPRGRLPKGPWSPLLQWLDIELPTAGFASERPTPAGLTLARSESFAEPGLLIVPLTNWVEYAIAAPQVRLDRWSFAASDDGRAIVRGTPLPPLPGERFVEWDGIAVAAGFTRTPAVEPAVVREVLRLDEGDLAVWHATGEWELVRGGEFTRATRSAVRRTAEAASHG